MSTIETEDDVELRDLVTSALQASGVLGKLKAQLRSNVYLALEGGEENLKKKSTLISRDDPSIFDLMRSSEGRLLLHLVREFLSFYRLDYTSSVFEPEAMEGKGLPVRTRDDLVDKLGLGELVDDQAPLLSEIIRLSKVTILKSETPTCTNQGCTEDESSLRSSLPEESEGCNNSPPHESLTGMVSTIGTPAGVHDNFATASSAIDKSSTVAARSAQSMTSDLSATTGKVTAASVAANPNSTYTIEKASPMRDVTRDFQSKCIITSDNNSLPLAPKSALASTANFPPLSGQLPPLKKQPSSSGMVEDLFAPSHRGWKTTMTTSFDSSPSIEGKIATIKSPNATEASFDEELSNAAENGSSSTRVIPSLLRRGESSRDQDSIFSPLRNNKNDVNEDGIDEDIDEFLNNNSSLSASEDYTRDETASKDESVKLDYAENLAGGGLP